MKTMKYALILLFLCTPVHAAKLLVNIPSGEQKIITVGQGGGYFDATRVVWDTRHNGPLPGDPIGGLVRCETGLCESSDRRAEHDIAVAARELVEQRRVNIKAAIAQCEALVDVMLDDWAATTPADVKRALRCVLRRARRK